MYVIDGVGCVGFIVCVCVYKCCEYGVGDGDDGCDVFVVVCVWVGVCGDDIWVVLVMVCYGGVLFELRVGVSRRRDGGNGVE